MKGKPDDVGVRPRLRGHGRIGAVHGQSRRLGGDGGELGVGAALPELRAPHLEGVESRIPDRRIDPNIENHQGAERHVRSRSS